MSNPAVFQLASTSIGNTEIRIEDNWAEAIHLHMGIFRVDLTVSEFLEIADRMADAANDLIHAENFDINMFDPIFLNYYNSIFLDLESVSMDKVRIGDIIAMKYNRLPFYRHLNKCRDYKALTGKYDELNAYQSQVNLIGQSNIERLNAILDSVMKNGYPYNNEYIILRNDQNVLLDGQHRASCLLYLYGQDYIVPVMRFNFKDKKYNVTDWHPWIKALCWKGTGLLKRIWRHITVSYQKGRRG